MTSGILGRTWLVGWLAALLLGCGHDGPELGLVSGVVRLDGQPLPDATIHFQPEEGSPSYGITDASGHYVLGYSPTRSGALVGPHVVRISTFQILTGPNEEKIRVPERVPPEYNEESELTRTVARGRQTIDFDLTGELKEGSPPAGRKNKKKKSPGAEPKASSDPG